MFTDKLQMVKSSVRTQKVRDLLGDKSFDERSLEYFLDVLNELGESMDLARGNIDLSGRNMNLEYVRRAFDREREIGNILLSDDVCEDDKVELYSYVDSICVEYAKFIHEGVGLLNFKQRVQDITDTLTDSSDYDFHDLLVSMAKSYDEELRDIKCNNKNDDNNNNNTNANRRRLVDVV